MKKGFTTKQIIKKLRGSEALLRKGEKVKHVHTMSNTLSKLSWIPPLKYESC